ncbi:MAG: ornithine cyclodeaminase family protein [Burkholderiales bacterium]|nr:ornithine cyclodeaminase family protein [Burkholderiales bacterium]MCW5603011.1 ornithine cyclodeaminase family protein [Burkholderiales bacterium]
MRYLSDTEIAGLLAWPDVIQVLRTAYQTGHKPDAVPARVVARGDTSRLRVLTAVPSGNRYMGTKIISSAVTGATYTIMLWAQDTSEPVCLLDAERITAMRTGGTSAVAMDRLLPAGPVRAAVLGAGTEASGHVRALSAIRKISSLTVFSPTSSNRERFAKTMAEELGVIARAVSTAREAVDGAQLVIAAARSRDETPILEGAWLAPGMLIVSIGSTLPEQREIDIEVVRRADLIVADMPDEVAHETGDMLAAARAGVDFAGKLISLSSLLQDGVPTARRAGSIVLFKSVGSGLQDVTLAGMCFDKALQQGVGTMLPVTMKLKSRKQVQSGQKNL